MLKPSSARGHPGMLERNGHLPPARPLAAVGILSHGGNRELRGWIRRSWLSPSAMRDAQASGIVVRFVLRGVSAPPEQRREAELNGDIAFVRARADLKRGRGPLLSLFLWWRLALAEWPGVQLIGKADGACALYTRKQTADRTVQCIPGAHVLHAPVTHSPIPRVRPRRHLLPLAWRGRSLAPVSTGRW